MGPLPWEFGVSYASPQAACDAAIEAARSIGYPNAVPSALGPYEQVYYPILDYGQQEWIGSPSYGHKCQFTHDDVPNIGSEFGWNTAVAIIIAPQCSYDSAAVSVDDQAKCQKYASPENAQNECANGDSPVSSPPVVNVGNPICVASGAKIQSERDYTTADDLLSVSRSYRSKARDLGRARYPLEIPGFGEHWHGLIPGRLTAYGYAMSTIEYLSPTGAVKRFSLGSSEWEFEAQDVTRLTLSMVTTPTTDRSTFFKEAPPSTPSNEPEMRLSFANGDYILFRRADAFIADTDSGNFTLPGPGGDILSRSSADRPTGTGSSSTMPTMANIRTRYATASIASWT